MAETVAGVSGISARGGAGVLALGGPYLPFRSSNSPGSTPSTFAIRSSVSKLTALARPLHKWFTAWNDSPALRASSDCVRSRSSRSSTRRSRVAIGAVIPPIYAYQEVLTIARGLARFSGVGNSEGPASPWQDGPTLHRTNPRGAVPSKLALEDRPGKARFPVSPSEKSLLQVESEIARRSAARVSRYLTRRDLSPVCRQMALQQLAEYRDEAARCEALLQSARWPFGVFGSAAATDRLRQAQAELSATRAELRADSLRAQHRAHALADTARIREHGEASRVPLDELATAAPSLLREMQQGVERDY